MKSARTGVRSGKSPRTARRKSAGAAAPAVDDLIAPEVRVLLEDFRLENVTSHLLRRAHFMAEEMFAREFAAESVTPRQKAALIAVYQTPGINQNALAERLHMDRNTVAEMVRRLLQRGLLSRVGASNDRRAFDLFLAPEGAQLLNRLLPRDGSIEARLLERLPPEYRALFVKCLRLMIDPAGPADPAQP